VLLQLEISQDSWKQTSIALSTVEVEYIAASDVSHGSSEASEASRIGIHPRHGAYEETILQHTDEQILTFRAYDRCLPSTSWLVGESSVDANVFPR
jgi:hypothetical protein